MRTGLFRTTPIVDNDDTVYIPITECQKRVIGITLTKRIIIVDMDNNELCECDKNNSLIEKYAKELQSAQDEWNYSPWTTCQYFGKQCETSDEDL